MANPNPVEARAGFVAHKEELRKKPREQFEEAPIEEVVAGPFDKATFEATMSGFQQNARGDYRVLLSVPYRCRDTIMNLSDAHGNLLTITVEKWRNKNV